MDKIYYCRATTATILIIIIIKGWMGRKRGRHEGAKFEYHRVSSDASSIRKEKKKRKGEEEKKKKKGFNLTYR